MARGSNPSITGESGREVAPSCLRASAGEDSELMVPQSTPSTPRLNLLGPSMCVYVFFFPDSHSYFYQLSPMKENGIKRVFHYAFRLGSYAIGLNLFFIVFLSIKVFLSRAFLSFPFQTPQKLSPSLLLSFAEAWKENIQSRESREVISLN